MDVETLPSCEPLALARFGVEAVLRTAIERYYANGADGRARWYLGEQIATFLAPGWRPAEPAAAAPAATDVEGGAQPNPASQRTGCGHSRARHYLGDGGRGHEGTGCKRPGCGCAAFLLDVRVAEVATAAGCEP